MGGGGPTYTPPPPSDDFAKYLQYTKEKEAIAEERAAQERKESKASARARTRAGAAAYGGLKQTVQQQLSQGLIGYETAANQLRDYAAKYDLNEYDWNDYLNRYEDLKTAFGGDVSKAAEHYETYGQKEGRQVNLLANTEADINELTQQYTAALPGKRETGIKASYEELLGRQATSEELAKAQERFGQGYYGSMEDFKSSLTKSSEYQDKFNQSYLDNYYDTQFGKQTLTAEGKKTGQRAFKFDSSLLPQYGGDLQGRTKVITPDFGKEFLGTPAELEAQQQNIRDTRQYLYSAGLTNLQGEIDKETQKLKNEGSKEIAQIGAKGSMYSNLLSGFWG
jgi:hypothetical protein